TTGARPARRTGARPPPRGRRDGPLACHSPLLQFGIERRHSDAGRGATLVQSVRLTFTPHRPGGTNAGLSTIAPAVTIATTRYHRSAYPWSSPMNIRTSGTAVSPAAAPSPVKRAANHHCGSMVTDSE